MSTAFRSADRPRRSQPRGSALYPVPAKQPVRAKQKSLGTQKMAATSLRSPPQSPHPVVRRLPTAAIPPWLKVLLRMQRVSVITTFVLVTATLLVYSSTMYTQQLWSKEYRRLEQLKRQERQLTTSGEILKHQLAGQAERPGSGLVPKTATSTIFLKPAPLRQTPAVRTGPPKVEPLQPAPPTPLGY